MYFLHSADKLIAELCLVLYVFFDVLYDGVILEGPADPCKAGYSVRGPDVGFGLERVPQYIRNI